VNNDWLDIAVLEDYLDGKLDAKTMNRVEREALEDPFVAEALAGLSMSPKRSLESLSLLQKQLHERVAEHHSAKKATVITWQRLSIAAAAAVIFISVGIIFWMKQVNYQEIASKQPKKIDVNIAPKVSSDSVIEKTDAVATVKIESTDKASAEIDKALKAAKTNNYAATLKPKHSVIVSSKVFKQAVPNNDEVAISAAPVLAKQGVQLSTSALILPSSKNVIRGTVVEAETGKPLENVQVKLEGTQFFTTTGKGGEFIINVDSSMRMQKVIANYIGFNKAETLVKVNEPVAISLQEDNKSLNEVVVVGYGAQRKRALTGSVTTIRSKEIKDTLSGTGQLLQGKVAGLNIETASPVDGWIAFREYIIKENRYNHELKKNESVELEFNIRRNKPTNIKIIKGLEDKYNKEAIRLLKDGPKWNQPTSGNSKISVLIDF